MCKEGLPRLHQLARIALVAIRAILARPADLDVVAINHLPGDAVIRGNSFSKRNATASPQLIINYIWALNSYE